MGTLCGQSISIDSPIFAIENNDPAIIAAWVEIALSTPTGFLWEAPEQCLDLREYILRPMSPDDLAVLPTAISHALSYCQQIASSDVTVSPTFTGGGGAALAFTIQIKPVGVGALPFTLVGLASADLVSIVLQGSA